MLGFAFFVIPTGFEPISSEPESEILSIELRDQNGGCKNNNFTTQHRTKPVNSCD